MPVSITPPLDLLDIWGSGASDVYAAGDAGTLLHFDGQAWSKVTTEYTGTLRAVWANSASDVFVGGERGNEPKSDEQPRSEKSHFRPTSTR